MSNERQVKKLKLLFDRKPVEIDVYVKDELFEGIVIRSDLQGVSKRMASKMVATINDLPKKGVFKKETYLKVLSKVSMVDPRIRKFFTDMVLDNHLPLETR